MQQGSLIDLQPDFDGATYDRAQDHARLTNQLALVRDYMLRHGEWRTLREIHAATGAPEASISARLLILLGISGVLLVLGRWGYQQMVYEEHVMQADAARRIRTLLKNEKDKGLRGSVGANTGRRAPVERAS
jgi:hypothetical protein